MKRYLGLILVILILVGCATKQERARKLITKANRLYPVSQMIDTIIKRDTILKIDTFIIVKGDTIKLQTTIEKPVNGKFSPYRGKELFNDAKAIVRASLTEEGVMTFDVFIKPKKQEVKIEYRYKDTIVVKKELITSPPKIIKVKGFVYYTGWATILAIIGLSLYKGYKLYKRITLIP